MPWATPESETEWTAPAAVTGKLRKKRSMVCEEYSYARARARLPLKVTVPSPLVLYGFWNTEYSTAAYPDPFAMFADAAEVGRAEVEELVALGCEYIQVDAPELATLVDPRRPPLGLVRAAGAGSPRQAGGPRTGVSQEPARGDGGRDRPANRRGIALVPTGAARRVDPMRLCLDRRGESDHRGGRGAQAASGGGGGRVGVGVASATIVASRDYVWVTMASTSTIGAARNSSIASPTIMRGASGRRAATYTGS
jgi:hypothetical protein